MPPSSPTFRSAGDSTAGQNASPSADSSARGAPQADGTSGRLYHFVGKLDRNVLHREYLQSLSKVRSGCGGTIAALDKLVSFMEDDPRVTDIRWMAYMLGTVFHESPSLLPRNELGKGMIKGIAKPYYWPVKVARMPDGTAVVTEQDGDQWRVVPGGKPQPLQTASARGFSPKLGVSGNSAVSPVYTAAAGTPLRYYGRGYVQLTWWTNYVNIYSIQN
jgi:hypothetical protein